MMRVLGQLHPTQRHLAHCFRKPVPIHRRFPFSTTNFGQKLTENEAGAFPEQNKEPNSTSVNCLSSYPLNLLKKELGEIESQLDKLGISVDQFVVDCIDTFQTNLPGSNDKAELSSPLATSNLLLLAKFIMNYRQTISLGTSERLFNAIAESFDEYMSIFLITDIFQVSLKRLESLNDRFFLYRQFKAKFKKNVNMGMVYSLFDPQACSVAEAFSKSNLGKPNSIFKSQKEIVEYLLNVLIEDDLIFVLHSVKCNKVFMKLIAELDFKEFSYKQLIQACFILRPIQKFNERLVIENESNRNFIISKIEAIISQYKLSDVDKSKINSIKKGSCQLDNLSGVFILFVQAAIRDAIVKGQLELDVSFICVFNNINLHHLEVAEIKLLQKCLLEKPLPSKIDLLPSTIFFHLAHLSPAFDPNFEIRFKILNHCKEQISRLESMNTFNMIALISSMQWIHQKINNPSNGNEFISPERAAMVNHLMEALKRIFIKNQFSYHIKTQEHVLTLLYFKANIISDSEFVNELEEKYCKAVVEGIKEVDPEVVIWILQILTKCPVMTKERARRILPALKSINGMIDSKYFLMRYQKTCLEEMRVLYNNCKSEPVDEMKTLMEEIEKFVTKLKKMRA